MANQSRQAARRFRINPIELTIFVAISLVFSHSVYSLFQEHPNLKTGMLTGEASTANPPGATSGGRAPASIEKPAPLVAPLLSSFAPDCSAVQKHQTQAGRIRLNGSLCGISGSDDLSGLLRAEITNTSNHYNASIFQDGGTRKYSTDYIPLVDGGNSIRIEFIYKGGKTITQTLEVSRGLASTGH